MDDLNSLGKRIREVRKKVGFLQEDFVKKLAISKSTLSEVENGNTKPSFEILKGLHLEFNVNLEFIFTGKGEMFRHEENTQKVDNEWDSLDFGEYTKEVKEILSLMKKSNFFMVFCITEIRKILLEYQSKIAKDIKLSESKTSIIEEINKEANQNIEESGNVRKNWEK